MSSLPLSPEQRAKRWGTIAKWAALGIGGYFFNFVALATLAGTAVLLVTVGLFTFVWAITPAVETAAANLRLRLLKRAAASDPISTLESEYQRRSIMLDDRLTAIKTFNAKTRTFGDKLDGFKERYPREAPKYQAIYDGMQKLLHQQEAQWAEARKGLTAFQGEIDKAKAMWEMALAANAAQQGSGLDDEAFYARLKTETALDTIQDGMNQAFSQLDTLVLEGDSTGDAPEKATIVQTPQAALPAGASSIELDTSSVSTPSYAFTSPRKPKSSSR